MAQDDFNCASLLRTKSIELANAISLGVSEVGRYLYAHQVINKEILDQILLPGQTGTAQAHKLLDVVMAGDQCAYDTLYEAVIDYDLYPAADILCPQRSPHRPVNMPDGRPDSQIEEPSVEPDYPPSDQEDENLEQCHPDDPHIEREFSTDPSLRESYFKARDLIKDHKVPLTVNDYTSLAAYEYYLDMEECPANDILVGMMAVSDVAEKMREKKVENLNSQEYTPQRAMKEYADLVINLEQFEDGDIMYFLVFGCYSSEFDLESESSILAVGEEEVYFLHSDSKQELGQRFLIGPDQDYDFEDEWIINMTFEDESELGFLSQECETILTKMFGPEEEIENEDAGEDIMHADPEP